MSNNFLKQVVFQRTDFPQTGWMAKANLTLFEANSGFDVPAIAETQSYRMPDRLSIQAKNEVLYTDFPQFGWILKSNNANLYEASSWYGVQAEEISSFRLPDRLLQQSLNKPLYTDFPQYSAYFIKEEENVWVDSYFETNSFRMERRPPTESQKKLLLTDFPQFGWIGQANQTNPFDPNAGWPGAVLEMQNYRMPQAIPSVSQNKVLYPDFVEQGWIGKPNLTLYEPSSCFHVASYELLGSYRMPDAQKNLFNTYLRQDYPAQTYEYKEAEAVFIPWTPADYEGGSYRMREAIKDRFFILQDQPQSEFISVLAQKPFVPGSMELYVDSLNYRMPDRNTDKSKERQDQPQFDWLYVPDGLYDSGSNYEPGQYQLASFRSNPKAVDIWSLYNISQPLGWLITSFTVFDPSFYTSAADQSESFRTDRSSIAQTGLFYADWPREQAVFQHFNPTYWPENEQLTKSFRMDENKLHRWGFEATHNVDWIIATARPFDPSLASLTYGTQDFRTPDRKQDKTFIRQDQPSQAWIFTAVPQFPAGQYVPSSSESQSYRMPDRKQDKTFIRQNVPYYAITSGQFGGAPSVTTYINIYRRRRRT